MAAIRWMVEIKVEVTAFHDPVVETKEEAVDATVEWLDREFSDVVVVNEKAVTVVRADPVGPRKPRMS